MQQTEATPRPHSADRGGGSFLRRLLQTREFGVFLALVVLLIVMRFLTPYFWKSDNVFNVLRGMSTIGIMAIGETMIIITGGIDLSVGSVLAASAMLTARLMYMGVVSPWVAVLIGIAFGTLLGAINGLIITREGDALHRDVRHVEHRTRPRVPAGIRAPRHRGQQRTNA